MEDRRVSGVMSATRLHFPEDTVALPEVTVQHLRSYAIQANRLGVSASIAVNILQESVRQVVREAAPGLELKVLHVPMWGAFVPALNTLLGDAQRRGMNYVLYQSLEVNCEPLVLQRMLDHHTSDTLVVGPELEGHLWKQGEQPLNGRSSPWNTLALWNLRKLALTGFLSIAEGLTAGSEFQRQCSNDSDASTQVPPAMGSIDWWQEDSLSHRQVSEASKRIAVPAGVEEVTAIAVLQHLLGEDRARAVLLRLPAEENNVVSWKANWGQDERRRQWHEYKMASKISRPAAQVQQLFGGGRGRGRGVAGKRTLQQSWFRPLLPPVASGEELATGSLPLDAGAPRAMADSPELNFGKVLHLGPSIRASARVEEVCLAVFVLFNMNFSAAFATAFRTMNSCSGENGYRETIVSVGMLLGGVYLPMPFSLWLARYLVSRYRHIAGMVLFFAAILIANSLVVVGELFLDDPHVQHAVLLTSRLISGLSSGVLFQCRYVLVTTSTNDHRFSLLVRGLQASDLGVVFGALLPALLCVLSGRTELPSVGPELLPAAVISMISAVCLVRVLLSFPRRLHQLPRRIRDIVPGEVGDANRPAISRRRLLFGGTMRIFVQSAIMMAVALVMRDLNYITHFKQTAAVAALCLLPAVVRAGFHLCDTCPPMNSNVAVNLAGLVLLVSMLRMIICRQFYFNTILDDHTHTQGRSRLIGLLELAVLMVSLAIASPVGDSSLYQCKDAERLLVRLEWMKAYIGRGVGPLFALAIYAWCGPNALIMVLGVLCCAGAAW